MCSKLFDQSLGPSTGGSWSRPERTHGGMLGSSGFNFWTSARTARSRFSMVASPVASKTFEAELAGRA